MYMKYNSDQNEKTTNKSGGFITFLKLIIYNSST